MTRCAAVMPPDPIRSDEPSLPTLPAAADEEHDLPSGVTLAVRRWGPPSGATPWLLVHGLASNARLWDGVARRLAAAGHPVAAVDQRGHGGSSKPDAGYDMVTVADDLHLLLGELGWARAAVAGQSWGGNVVVELAHRHPDDVVVAVAVDGGFIDLRARFPVWDDAATALAPPRLAGTRAEDLRRWLDDAHADWPEEGRLGAMANFELRPDGTVAPWLTFERHLEILRGLWEHGPGERFATLGPPILFIAADTGDADWTLTKRASIDAAVAAAPRARAEWAQAHHDIHAQHPDLVAELLRRSLDPMWWDGPQEDR